MSIIDLSLEELSRDLAEGNITSQEITEAYLKRIKEIDPHIKSYITITEEKALKGAKAADQRRKNNQPLGPLDGVPMALKDIFCTDGILTSCASKILYNYIPPYNATSWKRLEEAGAVLLGKCNMDEFAMGSSTENSAFFPTHNPYDLERVPGGSSGGSAAALAANLATYTMGTDTGGSVRQPASFCGVVGLKPTYGRISRFGIIPYASSLDQVGIFSHTVRDCAMILKVVAGHDEYDSTSAPYPVDNYEKACVQDIKGLKIGLPQEYLAEGIDPRIIDAVKEAAQKLKDQGAEIIEVSLPHTEYALPAYYVLATAEASSNLARYDGVRYGLRVEKDNLNDTFTATRSQGFGDEVKRRIMLGTYALSSGYYDAYYNKTLQVRTLVKADYDEVFKKVDCLLTPTAPTTAFKIGEKTGDPLSMYMSDVCTVPVNLAGLPGLSIPYGMLDGLPLGLQLIGPAFGESTLFRAGQALENLTEKLSSPDILSQINTKEGK